jgi:hypothetical protein
MCRFGATMGMSSSMKGEGVPVSAFFRECLSTGTPQQIHDRAPSPSHAVGIWLPTWWAPGGFAAIPTTALDPPVCTENPIRID